ncbi:hypothetical protein OL229_08375 [Neisseriaceae bacterium JH1-16]|nr:hypothetical protein [Neisseriaceae bacterium JH1-16]
MPAWEQWGFLLAVSLICRVGAKSLAAKIAARHQPAELLTIAPRWARNWHNSRNRLTSWFFALRGGVLFALLMTLWTDLSPKYLGFPVPLDPSWAQIGISLVTRLLGGMALMWAIWLINEFRFNSWLARLAAVQPKETDDGAA